MLFNNTHRNIFLMITLVLRTHLFAATYLFSLKVSLIITVGDRAEGDECCTAACAFTLEI